MYTRVKNISKLKSLCYAVYFADTLSNLYIVSEHMLRIYLHHTLIKISIGSIKTP